MHKNKLKKIIVGMQTRVRESEHSLLVNLQITIEIDEVDKIQCKVYKYNIIL